MQIKFECIYSIGRDIHDDQTISMYERIHNTKNKNTSLDNEVSVISSLFEHGAETNEQTGAFN